MATFVFTDASLVVNSVDLSAYVQSVTLNYNPELQDDTAMGDTARSRAQGLIDWSMDVTFFQDFDSGTVDDTLFSIASGSASVSAVLKPTSAAVSTSNPSYTGNVVIGTYQAVAGTVGDMATVTVNFASAGTLTRATA